MKISKFHKFIREGIIDYESDNLKNFINELRKHIGLKIEFKELQDIGNKSDISIVDYNTFYENLPNDEYGNEKEIAPPFSGRIIPYVNPVTKKISIVWSIKNIKPTDKIRIQMPDVEFLNHALKHENIHIKQINKMKKFVNCLYEPGSKGYFEDPQEMMANAQSISDMIINRPPFMPRIRNLKDAIKEIPLNPLYRTIKNIVDGKHLKRYNKYIYQYLEKEFEKQKKLI